MSKTEQFMASCAKMTAVAGLAAAAFAGIAVGGAASASAGCVTASGGANVDCDGTFGESRSGTQSADDRDGTQDAYTRYSDFFWPQYR